MQRSCMVTKVTAGRIKLISKYSVDMVEVSDYPSAD